MTHHATSFGGFEVQAVVDFVSAGVSHVLEHHPIANDLGHRPRVHIDESVLVVVLYAVREHDGTEDDRQRGESDDEP